MDTLYISKPDWESFIKGRAEKQEILAPVESFGSLFYARIDGENAREVVYDRARPVEPLKLFLVPFKESAAPAVTGITEKVVMGPAACDLKGLEILDKVFRDGDYKDPNYQKRRESTLIISFDCKSPYSSCFCELVGLHPYPEKNFDINLSRFEDGFLVDIGSEKGKDFVGKDQKFFQTTGEQIAKRRRSREQVSETVMEANRKFDLSSVSDIQKFYETELWKVPRDVENCVQCGSCTNNCPTCV